MRASQYVKARVAAIHPTFTTAHPAASGRSARTHSLSVVTQSEAPPYTIFCDNPIADMIITRSATGAAQPRIRNGGGSSKCKWPFAFLVIGFHMAVGAPR
eukprot:TRINITY_DN4958_c0_g2_i1.p2 TRINITY_DN4958_c0_g2~~TRINITY_DN4958_c0_g2_i1.p2  ORF type:complete len:100 (+),score=2.39 TRINITY_DN4958_c0_g2_i1:253-552(+)